ncbi:MAG: hypothetical protein A3B30_00915 [Candidatus Komeilibacteria bacterium RIFCSPLOWO2_01_FULL_52_15]|uniref:Nudix hydrolase domain-containing protein n=1 Tax=Candidatus Komeilibacteria bacterium RIFCSPLOWO2_01_FULL_52_15 TaxID=1798551 RepID=A0A1G2BQT6_9BACT|nr:MAG: hypothetical protein A3B30_00915 [Candidatus Komeilibacteria bacterium RIFCSPLOWO2_01_FULL_52_15]
MYDIIQSMVKPWRTTHSKYILNSPFLKVKRESVVLPDGQLIDDFYSIEGNTLVAVIVLDDHGQALLVRQYRQAIRRVTDDLPGGTVDPGETPQKAARREVLEETGYRIRNLRRLLTYFPDSGKKGDVKHLYVARVVERLARTNPNKGELIEYFWRPLSSLYKQFRKNGIHEATLALALQTYKTSHKKE